MNAANVSPNGPVELLLSKLDGVKRSGNSWMALCPSHEDRNPSLSVAGGAHGRALVKCHAGCSTEQIVNAIGLKRSDLFVKKALGSKKEDRVEVATYDYRDKAGVLAYQVVRYSPKDFRQRRPDANGGWIWNLKGVLRLPYRLPELISTECEDRRVFIVEGEKDCERLATIGEVATCNAGGAGKWQNNWAKYFADRECVIIADNDGPGLSHAANVYRSINLTAARVDICRSTVGSDISDYLDAGLSLDDLELLDISEIDPVTDVAGVTDSQVEHEHVGWEELGPLTDELHATLGRFVAFPSEHHGVAATLWIIHTHCMDAAESTPRLAILSPEPRSGKSRLLELIELHAPNPRNTVNITQAALFRIIEKERPTLLLDEADSYLGPQTAKQHEDIRALVNAGHRRGAQTFRCVGEGAKMDVKAFPAYCAVALAGLGILPDTIMDRSIVIPMRRRRPEDHREDFRLGAMTPVAHSLRDRIAAWSKHNCGRLGELRPDMPHGVMDRPADVWEPILAIADAAGGNWPGDARAACSAIVIAATDRGISRGVHLLADIRGIFEADCRDMIPTTDILNKLHEVDESPWSDIRGVPLKPTYLAKLLKDYGIVPQQFRLGCAVVRGYRRADFIDSWGRYLPPALDIDGGPSKELVTPGTPATTESCVEFDADLFGDLR